MHDLANKYPERPRRVTARAFTIIELLVVIVIIGLLTSVATASYIAAQKHARDTARKSSVNSIAAALESYYAVSHRFPGDALSQTNQNYPTGFPSDCEKVTNLNLGGSAVGISPYYFYSPLLPAFPFNNHCDGISYSASNYIGTGGSTSDFPSGSTNTWLPGLSPFINPTPIESKFANANGDSLPDQSQSTPYADVCDFLDSNQVPSTGPVKNACFQDYNQTRTLIYRNLLNHYAVYARLENDQDTEFDKQFSNISATSKCIPNLVAGLPDLSKEFSCVPYPLSPTNPIVVYLVRK